MRSSIPPERDTFVGRRREIAEVKRRLADAMLLTLTGIGGVGKSRIALRYASERHRAFPDGIFMIEIGNVADSDLVLPTIVTGLGFQDQSSTSPMDDLVARLSSRQCLIILDGCEVHREAVALVVEAILRGCPQVKVIAASRIPLGVPGESILTVQPMTLPPAGASVTPAGAREFDAVVFFADRADKVGGGFQISEQNVEDVVRLCRRLEGIPIALELAAARLRSLTPDQIISRLDDRYELLNDALRSAPFRQQTLRASLESSYDLCTTSERLMWARMSVFSGSFELDAVEGICSGGHIRTSEVLDLVQGLIDKSILSREDHGRTIRYRLLNILRSFGNEMLGELEGYSERSALHAAWYFDLVATAEKEWLTARQPYWLARLLEEHANVQTALTFALNEGKVAAAADCALGLWRYYFWARGWMIEGRHWLNRCLASLPEDGRRAKVLLLESLMSFTVGDFDGGTAQLEEGQRIAKQVQDYAAMAGSEHNAGDLAMYQGEGARAVAHFEKALTLVPDGLDALRIDTLLMLILACGQCGEIARAARAHAEILTLTEPTQECFQRAYSYLMMSVVLLRAGDAPQARALISESLRLRETIDEHDPFGAAWCAEILARISLIEAAHTQAAQLLGFASRLWDSMAIDDPTVERLQIQRAETRRQTERALGTQQFRKEFERGATLSHADIRQRGLGIPAATDPSNSDDDALTERERQVAALVSEGLTNREIAQRLVIATRTAEAHLQNAMLKLGFTSRSQVATWYVKRANDDGAGARRSPAPRQTARRQSRV
jgi:predicted ATPase/DNA-binding CsgD family transcriptional regulator